MQVHHPFKGDAAATAEGQVFAALQVRRLVGLVAAADQRQIASAGDVGPLLGNPGDLVAAEGFTAERALFLFLVKAVIQVFRCQQGQLVAGNQVGLLGGFDAAGDGDQITAGNQADVAARQELGTLLLDNAVFAGDLLVAAPVAVFAMFLIGSGGDDQVAIGLQGQVSRNNFHLTPVSLNHRGLRATPHRENRTDLRANTGQRVKSFASGPTAGNGSQEVAGRKQLDSREIARDQGEINSELPGRGVWSSQYSRIQAAGGSAQSA
nr:hypothetical protein [Halopseudomonas yangmingensis]